MSRVQTRWWREPWPWILMAGPFLAIVGCIITIALAVSNYGDQAITQGGVKRGLVVTKQANDAPRSSSNPPAEQKQ